MSENDYIAEYIKERRPELIRSFDFILWKMSRITADAVKKIIDTFSGIDLSSVDLSALQQAAAEETKQEETKEVATEEETPEVAAGGEE